jgi:hypothetical protein
MAVVTFSPQTDMIREVLREKFGADLAMQVCVFVGNGVVCLCGCVCMLCVGG